MKYVRARKYCLAGLMVICLLNSACTLGPRVETRFVLVQPGSPIQILSNLTVTGRRLGDDSIGTQAIGGWVAMPQEHFDALKRAAQGETR